MLTARRVGGIPVGWPVGGFELGGLTPRPTYVRLTGAASTFVTTPDSVANSITTDVTLIACLSMDDWTPAANTAIVGKQGAAGNRSYLMQVLTTGIIRFGHSVLGTTLVNMDSTVAPTISNGALLWIASCFDADNGAAAKTLKVYTATGSPILSPDALTWTQLGTTVTSASASSIFDGTAAVEVGSAAAGANLLTGNVYRAQVRQGCDIANLGTIVADFCPHRDITATTTAVASTSGETWTLSGAAAWAA